MNIKALFIVALIGIYSLFTPKIVAMDTDLVEARITSMFEKPLDQKAVNQLSNDIKTISATNQQAAQDFLDQAYILLISDNKFDLAQALLENLKSAPPVLHDKIEQLEVDLVSKISEAPQPIPPEPKLSEAEVALAHVADLLKKEPFTLENAKDIDNIIDTAIANSWKINISQLMKTFIMKSFNAYVAGSVDNRIVILLSASLKRKLPTAATINRLIAELFEKMIPTQTKTANEKQNKDYFIIMFLKNLFDDHTIDQKEFDAYFAQAIAPMPEPQKPTTIVRPPSPTKPTADPELAKIIKEHAINKSAIENQRIEPTGQEEMLLPLLDMPSDIRLGSINLRIQQMPALTQLEYRGKSPEKVIQMLADTLASNYCGYYAAYNIWCIATKQQNNTMNRNLFVENFGPMLALIKKTDSEEIKKEGIAAEPEKNHKYPYDELAGYEIEYLLKKEFKIEPDQYLNLGIAAGTISSASENLKAGPARDELLESFRVGPFNKEKIVPILFNVEANHWVAIKATRKENTLSFDIYDSLGKRNWQDVDEDPAINATILKNLAIYLTTPGMN